MTTINSNSDSSYLDSLKKKDEVKQTDAQKSGALTQSDFFALLTQQLAFQDPTKPVENDQMIAQMTNFTMADGIGSLNNNFKDFAASMNSNQALQASSLVGRTVLVDSDKLAFDGTNPPYGSTTIPANASTMSIKIYNQAGELIRNEPVENPVAGKYDFIWDGKNNNGEAVAKGLYKMTVDVSVAGKNESLPTSTYVPVASVTLGKSTADMTLNLYGIGAKKMSDVKEIAAS
jgi:flagellar basal-body rod modification protein FlgD